MNFSNSNINFGGRSAEESHLANADPLPHEANQTVSFAIHLEKLALLLAQTWKADHPHATAHSKEDLNDCILAVTTELAIAARAVGGPIGLEILTGGGSAAACAVCRQVLDGNND